MQAYSLSHVLQQMQHIGDRPMLEAPPALQQADDLAHEVTGEVGVFLECIRMPLVRVVMAVS
jgi:hypothetical protein